MAKKPTPTVEPAPEPVAVQPVPEPPTLKESLDAIPYVGNEKAVPSALLVGLSADALEDLGYVLVRSGHGVGILTPSPVRK